MKPERHSGEAAVCHLLLCLMGDGPTCRLFVACLVQSRSAGKVQFAVQNLRSGPLETYLLQWVSARSARLSWL